MKPSTTVTDTNALPALAEDYAIGPEQIETFRASGHVLLRGLASPEEIAAYRPLISQAARYYNVSDDVPEEEKKIRLEAKYKPEDERKVFLQTLNLWTKDPVVERFSLARRFAHVAATLMGVAGVRIYHDQALFKEPGDGPTGWHQDQHYWPLDTDNTVTMWMPLVDIPAELGTMRFASGSHRFGYFGDFPINAESQERFEGLVGERNLPLHSYGAMTAGDATFHSGWTLHSAPGNETRLTREVMTVIYFADGARVTPPDNPSRENDLRVWMPGLQPGDLAASPINPVVFSETTSK